MEISRDKGFIVLHRSLLDWEWYTDTNTCHLFTHLLLTVNHTPKEWKGITIERGQRVASYSKLALETGLTVKEIRTALNHLKQAGEVAHKAYPKFGLFIVKNYDEYQSSGTQAGSQQAPEGQSMGSRRAVKGQQLNNENNENNEEQVEYMGASRKAPPADKPPKTRAFVPPSVEEVKAYCLERGNNIDPQYFVDYYDSNGWMVGKTKMKDWKATVRRWEANERKNGSGAERKEEKPIGDDSAPYDPYAHVGLIV